MIRTGLCSVTFRSLPPREVVRVAAEANLDGIEWGADVHVPVGELATAEDVATSPDGPPVMLVPGGMVSPGVSVTTSCGAKPVFSREA